MVIPAVEVPDRSCAPQLAYFMADGARLALLVRVCNRVRLSFSRWGQGGQHAQNFHTFWPKVDGFQGPP